MFKSNHERRMRYSIRKFSVGVASVAVASLFMGSVVHATEKEGTTQVATSSKVAEEFLNKYRQTLIKELEETDLSSSRKAYYQGKIKTETDASKLMELENDFHDESRKEHEQAVDQASTSLSMYMTSLLDELDSSASGFGDILKQAMGIVNEYRTKIGGAYNREEIEKLKQEGQTKLDELTSKFKKGLSSSEQNDHATPKGPSLNDGVQGDDSSVGQGKQPGASNQKNPESVPPTRPDKKENDVKPETEGKTPPSTEGKPQTSNEEAKKLKALEELKKLEQALAEVNQYPELSESNPDYRVQKKEFWDYSKTVAPKKMQAFKMLLEKGSYTEQDLQRFIDDFIYYQIHAQIEKMTRQVALYRAKYPKITSLEREFESGIKQTNRSNYGTLEGTALKTYFERDFRPAFNKIQQIVAIQETLNKLDDETKTVPDGAKLTGGAGKAYNEARDDAGKVVSESQELLSQTTVTMDKLVMQLTKLNDAMSKLKEAKAKLVPEVKPKPENPEHQKPSTPGIKEKVAEAEKKLAEAEKKVKDQKEADRRNYPSNTRKTVELEIAEAQVEVKKAELELAQAEAQTPQNADTINAAKAKVEVAKSNVKKLEKIKSDSDKSQADEQKPTTPALDTPKEPDNKKPSVPTPEKPTPQPEKPKPEVKPQPEAPKTTKIITASDGKTKVTVIFDKAVDADKVNIKEVATKELAEKIARQTGGGTVRVFDLSLSKGGKETHVNGERTVRLALGQTASDVHVYHVKENGDLERIPSKVENGQVVFKTNHFSLFAIKTLSKNQNITTPKQTKPSIQDSQTQIGENQTGKSQNKEVNHKPLATGNETVAKENPTSATEKKLPSTGAATNLVLEIIGLLGLAGTSLIAMKRRK